jgi:outer membrane receptor protein involved in Fe transport
MMVNVKLKPVALAVAVVLAATSAYAADAVKTNKIKADKVDVVSTTPMPGIGLSINKVPANIQLVNGDEFKQQQSVTIADYMNNNLQGVSVVDTQNNPFQPDVTFRGFTASPLLGTPQGMSVYVDGVRVNEPFGDAVNWDLIPMNAISNMSLIPGTNPLFGLNTLGGAISIQTKSGRTHQGGAAELSAGSWGRKAGSAEIGGVSKDGSVDYFFSANMFSEDGWRQASPTDVRQFFGKVGWQNETTKIDLSYTNANNDMIGNGLVQGDLMKNFGRNTIHTKPDQTKNTLSFLNLSGSHWFNDDVMFSGNAYYRDSKRKTLNGDVNDDFNANIDAAPFNGDRPYDYISNGNDYVNLGRANTDCTGSTSTAGVEADEACSGAINRSRTKQHSYGLNGQLAFNQDLAGKKNQFIVGASYDISKIKFNQSTELGLVNTSRGIDGLGTGSDYFSESVNLHGKTKTWSLFGTDTLSLNDYWHVTASGRYNHVKVNNVDQINAPTGAADDPSLSGNHTFTRFNPAVGLNFTPTKDLTVYGSYNEGNRAPTSMELGCANPLVPCKLPNAMAGDPPLNQVVVKTYEGGLRGNLTEDVRWSAAVYRSENHDDIQFITVPSVANGMGYFDNVGKTRRVGIDTNLMGKLGQFSWSAGYSFVDATYQNDLQLQNEVNSTVQADNLNEAHINVRKGDRLANIPQHQLKLRMQYAVTPDWTIGSNITAFSDRYMRGNENNRHVAGDETTNGEAYAGSGKVAGYMVVNLDTRYNIGNGWSVFGKAINVFDHEYNNGGLMGESLINPTTGTFDGVQRTDGFFSPGAPRAGWVGVRYEFLAPKAQ